MIAPALALCIVLAAAPAGSAEPAAPQPAPLACDAPTRVSYLVPALETASIQFGLLAFNNLVRPRPFALVSWDTLRSHFDGQTWTFEEENFVTNQFGHPYQGSLSFAAARSSGVSFWASTLYTIGGSVAWEVAFETDPPSINDQITTTLGGIFLGEVLHRAYVFVIREADGPPSLVRNLGSILISPMSAANRWLYGGELRASGIDPGPPFHFSFSPGVSISAHFFERREGETRLVVDEPLQALLSGELMYGAPGDPDWRYEHPFSQFNVEIGLAFPGTTSANLFIRGLLVGSQYGEAQNATRGVWGLFGLYDFGASNVVRASSVALGPGTTLQIQFDPRSFLRGTFVLGPGFATAGSPVLETAGAPEDRHIGPGAQGVLDVRYIRPGLGMVGVRAREWLVDGFLVGPVDGYEAITYASAFLQVRVRSQIALGLDVPLWLRISTTEGTHKRLVGSGTRVVVSWMSDDLFGVNPE